jgi:RNase P subunit RPR2
MEGFCVKCKAKREMRDTTQVTLKNGKPAIKGVCAVCGTKMFIVGKKL